MYIQIVHHDETDEHEHYADETDEMDEQYINIILQHVVIHVLCQVDDEIDEAYKVLNIDYYLLLNVLNGVEHVLFDAVDLDETDEMDEQTECDLDEIDEMVEIEQIYI